MAFDHATFFLKKVRGTFTRRLQIAVLVFFFVALFVTGVMYAWAQSYEGRMAPQVWVGDIFVGGMDVETAESIVQEAADKLLNEGIPLEAEGDQRLLPLAVLVGKDMTELVHFDIEKAMDEAVRAARNESPLKDSFSLLYNMRHPEVVPVDITLYSDQIEDYLRVLFPNIEQKSVPTQYAFRLSSDGWKAEVIEGKPGYEFNDEVLLDELASRLPRLGDGLITVPVEDIEPEITVTEAEVWLKDAETLLNRAPFTMTLTEDGVTMFEHRLYADDIDELLLPRKEELTMQEDGIEEIIERIASEIEIDPINAQFSIEDQRVTEFTPSQPGRTIDREKTIYQFATTLLETEETEIDIIVYETDPDLVVSDVNDLGIVEKLGVGTSSYRWSPTNRIYNISNGVGLLNGVLIAPDETFSLLEALKPFTFANGYFEELVIKGDKIEPEIGGGLCQIGTTTFRAAMNSGLPIVERNNHSLVVSYYNDPSNGNPGTDATIYDPAPDFKFLNDTGNYVLFQAEMFWDTQDLEFTFWGTSDGRDGSYSAPVVQRWIPVDDPIETETLDLEPGEETCQEAHIGADAIFTYTVITAEGETMEQVFESHYRPLPRICLIGVEELSVEGEEGEEGEGGEEEIAEDTDEEAGETEPVEEEEEPASEEIAE